MLRETLGVLAGAALLTIAAYVLLFAGVALWTVHAASRRDPLTEELEALLEEDLDRLLADVASSPGVAGGR